MKNHRSIKQQFLDNSVALISLVVAFIALFYTAWREETTEKNFNTRAAAFEVLKNLGQLQVTVNYLHYDSENPMSNPLMGWGHVSLIGDLSEILPQPIPAAANALVEKWGKSWNKLKDDEELTLEISQSIDDTRASILKVLKDLQ